MWAQGISLTLLLTPLSQSDDLPFPEAGGPGNTHTFPRKMSPQGDLLAHGGRTPAPVFCNRSPNHINMIPLQGTRGWL